VSLLRSTALTQLAQSRLRFFCEVAEAAWDEIEAGKATTDVAPFWRVIDPKSPLAKKLRAGGKWIEQQRLAELR